jgi:hypothetical protein
MEKSNISIATIEMYQLLDRLASEWQIIKHPAPEGSWEVLSDGKTLGLGTSRILALQSACKNLEEPLKNFSIFYLRI